MKCECCEYTFIGLPIGTYQRKELRCINCKCKSYEYCLLDFIKNGIYEITSITPWHKNDLIQIRLNVDVLTKELEKLKI